LGGKLLGWRTVCAVELDAYCRRVLLARQRDGFLPRFPIWDNVTTFDGKPWRGGVDVVSGGFPCTDISQAKQDARGIDGDESGLWREMARIIGEVRPRFVFVENSAMLVVRGLGRVLGDLARMGFCTWHGVLGACHVGAPHNRRRVWIVGHAECARLEGQHKHGNQAQGWSLQNRPDESAGVSILEGPWRGAELTQGEDGTLRYIQPGLCGVAYGVAHRVDRLKAIGNGQVPAVAALAWRLLGGPQ
jgi:DNA (cytosine-5)-methyltransferase 1